MFTYLLPFPFTFPMIHQCLNLHILFSRGKVNLDPTVRNIQELKSWPEFHNAVAAGLRLAPLQVCHLLSRAYSTRSNLMPRYLQIF